MHQDVKKILVTQAEIEQRLSEMHTRQQQNLADCRC